MKQIVKTRLLATIIATAVGLLVSGCLQREVEHKVTPTEGKLDVSVDWGEAAKGDQQRAFRMLIYNDKGTLHQEQTSTGNHMQWTLPQGSYHMIVHNTDGANVRYLDMGKHSEGFVYVTSNSGQLIDMPQNIYTVAAHDNGKTFQIVGGGEHLINVSPQRATRGVHFTFKIIGLPEISSLRGTLSGVSPGMMIATGEYLDVPCIQPFVGTPLANRTAANSKASRAQTIWYQTDMEFFNLVSNEQNAPMINVLGVEIVDGNQNKYTVTSDITSSVHEIMIENGGELPVEVPLDVEIEVVDGAIIEIRVSVSEWQGAGEGMGNVIN